jgi:Reverse transcriptase (RNA-dependent DNA polymerase)
LFIFYISEMQGRNSAPDDAVKRVAKGTYADDALNWAMGKSYALAARRIQANLRTTEAWCKKWRLELNPLKCECILFGHYNSRPTVHLEIGGRQIPQVKEMRYLGIILTPQLCWEPHIATISAKARPRAGVVRRIAVRRVLPHKTSILFHRALVESVLTYAAPAWYCQPDSSKQRLQELQQNGIRAALNLPFDADTRTAQASYGIIDIRDAATKQLANYGVRRLESNGTTAAYIRHVCSLTFDVFGRKIMESHCPAWRLKPILDPEIQPVSPIRRNWLRIRND